MTILHHPSDTTLAAFAAGSLDEGQSLVVAVHLRGCVKCRAAVRAFEHVGGVLMEDIEPVALAPEIWTRALAQLETAPANVPAPSLRDPPGDDALPAPLAHYPTGAWRWMGRGVQWCSVDVPAGQGTRVFMLKARPGTHLPHHKHVGTEWTCVLRGAFAEGDQRFAAGDFDEADESVEHIPLVEAGDDCICLVAMQGHIELQGWLGRILQPFVRF